MIRCHVPSRFHWRIAIYQLPLRKIVRQHSPLAASPVHVEDGVEDLASGVFGRLRARLGCWNQGFQGLPLRVGEVRRVGFPAFRYHAPQPWANLRLNNRSPSPQADGRLPPEASQRPPGVPAEQRGEPQPRRPYSGATPSHSVATALHSARTSRHPFRVLLAQDPVNELDAHGALADGGGDPLDTVCANVADGEDARAARLEEVRRARSGQRAEASSSASGRRRCRRTHLRRAPRSPQPRGVGWARHREDVPDGVASVSPVASSASDSLQVVAPLQCNELRATVECDGGRPLDATDEVAGHARVEARRPDEHVNVPDEREGTSPPVPPSCRPHHITISSSPHRWASAWSRRSRRRRPRSGRGSARRACGTRRRLQ